MPNRLAAEQSPYLRQHQHNPVDWYPWSDEAFGRARAEQKPIFLSIGYSTCHWCHVMERESFEHQAVADLLNQHFVSIKVDREERPDVDRVYMTFVQATTGSGGWPMSVWLTPSLQPFFGGTYFPPASSGGRPGFGDVLQEVARVWREDRSRVERSAAVIVERLRTLNAAPGRDAVPPPAVLDAAVRDFAATFDSARGGFGDAPKFPRPSELLFLLREHARTGAAEPRDMALTTLRAMALGGMRDHVGGGFHRYAVDRDWRVPHFEKMLYDQAQLVLAYLDAAQVSGEAFFADVAADTLDYVRREMTDAAGGFHSAEDADSVPPEQAGRTGAHAMEGAFYLWSDDELGARLGADAAIVRLRFGVRPEGNAPFDPHHEFTGKNLLYAARSVDEIASTSGRPSDEIRVTLARARQVLADARAHRPRPGRDDKVLTAWNGLMIAACARAARVLPDGAAALAMARRAATFVRTTLWDDVRGGLWRRYRQGTAGIDGYAEDYAYLVYGLLELFQADGDPEWLAWAIRLQEEQDARFWDEVDGGWFSTTGEDPSVLLRVKEDYDGAEPAATSVSIANVLVLAHLLGRDEYRRRAERALRAFAARASELGRAVPMLLAALSTYHAGMPQIVIAGDPAAGAGPLFDVVRRRYLPGAVVVPLGSKQDDAVARLLPWTAPMSGPGSATAYVCDDFVCQAPATSAGELAAQLDGLQARRQKSS